MIIRLVWLFLAAATVLAAADELTWSFQLEAQPAGAGMPVWSAGTELSYPVSDVLDLQAQLSSLESRDPEDLRAVPWELSSLTVRARRPFIDTFSQELEGTLRLTFTKDSHLRIGMHLDGANKAPPFSWIYSAGITLTPPYGAEYRISASLLQVVTGELGISWYSSLQGQLYRQAFSGLPHDHGASVTAGMRTSLLPDNRSHHISVECIISPQQVIPQVSYLFTLDIPLNR